MADSAGLRVSVDSSRVPDDPCVIVVCEAVQLDRWRATSAGSVPLSAAPDSTDRVVSALRAADTTTAAIGFVTQRSGVHRDSEPTEWPAADSSWKIYRDAARVPRGRTEIGDFRDDENI